MPEKFKLIPNREKGQGFQGYRSKTDLTALPPGILVPPSQNVLTNDADRIAARAGYTLDGDANNALTPVRSSYDWNTSTGAERNLRFYDDELEYRYVASDGTVTWRRLADGYSTTAIMQFAEFWDTTEKIDILLFVDGTSNIREWSGAITTIASVGTNTLTKSGSTTWAQERFLTAGTRQVVIQGVTYTYTGGESTTTLTGVTPDPAIAAPAIVAGDICHQAVRTTAFSSFTKPASFASTDTKDLIAVLNNQVYLGSTTSRYVHVSRQNSFTNYSQSSPRAPGEGETLTLDGAVTAMTPESNESDQNAAIMYISAGKDFWYRVGYVTSSDFTKESVQIKRLLTAPEQAARSQYAVAKAKNGTVFISFEPTLDEFARLENIDTPQSKPISEPIKTDFEDHDFANCHLQYHKRYLYLALPAESLVLMYNVEKGYWEAPQVLPVRRLAIIDGALYGHSSATPETYKLFDGTDDNDNPIHSIAAMSYENGGARDQKKSEDKNFFEGYISSNTILDVAQKYDFGGFTSIVECEIDGSDSDIIFSTTADGSFGKNPLGNQPIGSVTDSISGLPKFRQICDGVRHDYYEKQVVFETNGIHQQWEILAYGSNATLSPDNQFEITK